MPILDRALLDDLLNGVGVDAGRLLETFCHETERRLNNLQTLSIDAREAIRLEAHTLKGSCGMVGTEAHERAGARVEGGFRDDLRRCVSRRRRRTCAGLRALARDELARHLAQRGIALSLREK